MSFRQVQTVWKQRHNESHSELLLSDAENRQIHLAQFDQFHCDIYVQE